MSEYGVVTEARTIRMERLLPGPIERVWDYLTDSTKRGKWFATGKMDLRPGGSVEFFFNHADLSAEKTPPEKHKHKAKGVSVNGGATGAQSSMATPQCRRGRALPTRACSTQLIAIRAKSWWSSIRRTPRRQKLLLLRQISRKRWQKPVSWIRPRSISLNQ
jgi:Activator of Hsp90 ATPase homolog 1-like protein